MSDASLSWRRCRLLVALIVVGTLGIALWRSVPSVSASYPAAPAAPQQPPVPTPGADQLVVRGRIFYTDRQADRQHPAAGVKVEIWDLDFKGFTQGEKLDEVLTDAGGRFESHVLSNVDRDGPTGQRDGTQDVFIKFFSDNGSVRLLKAGTNQEFVWNSYEIDNLDGVSRNVPDGYYTISPLYISTLVKDIEALWTYVNLTETWFYLKEQSGRDPGKVTAYWSKSSRDGPRLDLTTGELFFRDEDAGFSSLVMGLETYLLLHNLWGGLPAAWTPCITPEPSLKVMGTPTCGFVQGFASFVPLAVTGLPDYETPLVQNIDLDKPKAGTPGWQDGENVPGRVAGGFWDLYEKDETNDGSAEQFDRFNATFKDIWDVMDQKKPNTMAEWWAGWKALGKPTCGPIGSLYQNTIDYNTGPQIQPIPDVIINEDETAELNLANYIKDSDCADEALVITMVDAGLPEAGVKLIGTRMISITPQADWHGETRVRLSVTDGLVTVPITFKVIVRSINDCPKIQPRIPDPAPAYNGADIMVNLLKFGHDIEDAQTDLAWSATLDSKSAGKITVSGMPGPILTFSLDPTQGTPFSARARLTLRDKDGCEVQQSIGLYWTDRTNTPPYVIAAKWRAEFVAPVNNSIRVDLTDVASDKEDGPKPLAWFVLNPDKLHAQVARVGMQVIDFEPDVGFIGTDVAELEVVDTGGARTTAAISLTWKSVDAEGNIPPHILRAKLIGRQVGKGGQACYDLTDKAEDPDDNPLSLRWYAEPLDEQSLFVGPQGTRSLCFTSRPDFEGCLAATFIVKDPKDAEDRYEVETCWKRVDIYFPFALTRR